MTDKQEDLAVVTALLERFTKQRLPRLREMLARVDAGERLDDVDMEFMEQAMGDGKSARPLIERHPELDELAKKVIGLYHEIMTKALENEKKA
jgi:hypothetical protein